MEQKTILRAISNILVHDVVEQRYNIITFMKLSGLLEQKYAIKLTPSDIDRYLEELSLICFALNLPLLSALVVGQNYQPSPRFFKLHRELYQQFFEHPRQVHESEVKKIMAITDWTPLFDRLPNGGEGVNRTNHVTPPPTFTSNPTPVNRPSLQTESEYVSELEHKVILAMENGMISRRDRLEKANPIPKKIQLVKTIYDVNPDVIAEVMIRANGFCESCGQMAPFRRQKDQRPFLKVHYKTPFEKGGLDSVDNALAVCPNCFEKLND